jgi:hypothetical protein
MTVYTIASQTVSDEGPSLSVLGDDTFIIDNNK